MNADDWIADNGASVADLETNENNPGGYDAINRYGDENLNPTLNQMIYGLDGEIDTASILQYPGLDRWHRKGYWEKDLVDYDTENLKTSLGLYSLFDNDMMLSATSSFSTGTTVYQGDNRFSLKDILFFQNKIELKKDNDFFIRLYATHEDAGNSYDANNTTGTHLFTSSLGCDSTVTETETILSQPFAKTNVSCPVGLAPL